MRKIISMLLVFLMIMTTLSIPMTFAAEGGANKPFTIDKKGVTLEAEEAHALHKGVGMVGTYASVNMNEWLDFKVNVL